jgi:ParB/RepB/Spo0J family partition protein
MAAASKGNTGKTTAGKAPRGGKTTKKSAPARPKLTKATIKGQGLSALLARNEDGRQTHFISLDEIRPDPAQPRTTFHPVDGVVPKEALDSLRELADNIHSMGGLIHPISVRVAEEGGYVISQGERRWRAYLLNRDLGRPGSDKIESFIREDISEAFRKLGQLAENIQREGLTDIDIAVYLKAVMEEFPELQQKDLAELLNKDPRWISRILGLLDPRYEEVVMNGHIIFAAVLEQFKTLPKESQTKLHAEARERGTRITTHQIRQEGARSKGLAVPPAIPEVTGKEALQRLGLTMASGGGPNSELLNSVESVLMSGKVADEHYKPGGLTPGRQELRLRFSQALTLGEFLLLDDEQVSLQLDSDDIRRVIQRMGGKPPKEELGLVPMLMDLLVSAAKKAKKD